MTSPTATPADAMSRRLLPEDRILFSQLPEWRDLAPEVQERFDREVTRLLHEYFLFLEEVAIPLRIAHSRDSSEMQRVEAEERVHAGLFRNAIDRTHQEERGGYLHLRGVATGRFLLRAGIRLGFAPAISLLILLLEEGAVEIADALDAAERSTPGSIEPWMLALHRRHRDDETRHVEVHARIVIGDFERMPRWRRILSLAAFAWCFRRMTVPRRGNRSVLRAVAADHPQVRAISGGWIDRICAPSSVEAHRLRFFGPAALPRTWSVLASLDPDGQFGRRMGLAP
jgi:hypothetical protein